MNMQNWKLIRKKAAVYSLLANNHTEALRAMTIKPHPMAILDNNYDLKCKFRTKLNPLTKRKLKLMDFRPYVDV